MELCCLLIHLTLTMPPLVGPTFYAIHSACPEGDLQSLCNQDVFFCSSCAFLYGNKLENRSDQTGRQAGRHTDKQTDRQTNRQVDRKT